MRSGVSLASILILSAFFLFLILPGTSAVNVSSCQTLNSANTIYTLTANLTSATNCIIISANNITLDGQGYYINGTNEYPYTGVYLISASNYSTVKNMNVRNFSIGIYSPYASNQIFMNNTVVGSANYGIYLPFHNNNLLINNSVSDSQNYGVFIYGSSNNTVIGNVINRSNNTALYFTSSSNNTITNNSIRLNRNDGIYMEYSNNNNFTNNYLLNNSGHAVNLSASNGNVFANMQFLFTNLSNYDFYIYNSNNTKISNFISILNYSFLTSYNTVFEDFTYGQIQILNSLDGRGQNFTKDIVFANNSLFVNSSSNSGLFNKSANITFYGIGDRGYITPGVFKNNVVCGECYSFTSLSSVNPIFNVSSAGYYYIGETYSPPAPSTSSSDSSSGGGSSLVVTQINISKENLKNGFAGLLVAGDKYSFAINEKHTLTLNSFNSTSAGVTIQSEPSIVSLVTNENKIIHLDSQGLLLRYNGIKSGRAQIFIQQLNEKHVLSPETAQNYTDSETSSAISITKRSPHNIIYSIGFILIIAFLYFVYMKLEKFNS